MEVALHTFFRLVSKSMTLDDLERQKRTLAEKDRCRDTDSRLSTVRVL